MLPAITEDPFFHLLSPMQQAFVTHPLIMKDAKAAAMAVGYSEAVARCHAPTMRKQLMYYIRPIQERRLAEISVTAERIRDELAAVAFAKITDYYDTVDIGNQTVKIFKDPALLPEAMQRAIKSVELETVVDAEGNEYQSVKRIELFNKMEGLRELEDIMGLKDAKMRAPKGNIQEEEAALLEMLDPKELALVERMYARASKRARELRNQKRDASALPGESKKVEE